MVDRTQRLLLVSLVAALLVACADPAPVTTEFGGRTMGTTWSVKIVADRPPDELQSEIELALEAVNDSMSTYRKESALSRFNRITSTDWFAVPADLVRVIKTAQDISRLSGGAFDVTIGPLVNLWGFGPSGRPPKPPNPTQIAAALALVGHQKLSVRTDPPALRKTVPGLYVDLSSIAKGHGVDRIADLLAAHGVENYLVEIGGELRGRGYNASGRPWRIAVERPDSEGRAVHQVVQLGDAGMATSGDYRNFFVDGGRRYSHTIDISTGRPVAHSLASVTVIAADCTRADGLATALMAMGPDRGFALAEREGIPALFIERTDGGFKDRATADFVKVIQETRNNA